MRRRRDFRDQGGYCATQETARLKKQRRDRPGQLDQKVHFQVFRDRGGDGATFQTKVETRDFPDRGGDCATLQLRKQRDRRDQT